MYFVQRAAKTETSQKRATDEHTIYLMDARFRDPDHAAERPGRPAAGNSERGANPPSVRGARLTRRSSDSQLARRRGRRAEPAGLARAACGLRAARTSWPRAMSVRPVVVTSCLPGRVRHFGRRISLKRSGGRYDTGTYTTIVRLSLVLIARVLHIHYKEKICEKNIGQSFERVISNGYAFIHLSSTISYISYAYANKSTANPAITSFRQCCLVEALQKRKFS